MCICSVCMYNFVCLEKLQMQCYMFSPSCFSTLIALLVFPGRDALLRFLLYHFYWSSWLFFNTIILSKSYQDSHLSFFKVYLFYFKGKLERHFCWFTPRWLQLDRGWAEPKPGTTSWCLMWVLGFGHFSHLLLTGCICKELDQK